jgi:hypothetical protein
MVLMKESDAHFFFETLNLLAQRRLSHMQSLCRPTKMQRREEKNGTTPVFPSRKEKMMNYRHVLLTRFGEPANAFQMVEDTLPEPVKAR